jgi:excinuclease UvrABC nuclease subunit
MADQTYNLEFGGYWLARNINGMPAKSGIYWVYACTYNPRHDTVSLERLLYIGESENVRSRVSNHESWNDWRRKLKPGEELCFNAALITPDPARERAEAAMIFKHKPPCNSEYVNSFPFDKTTVRTSGKNALLSSAFTVHRTQNRTSETLLSGGRR